MIALYSIKIFCDGSSVDKIANDKFGFYPDYIEQSNPAIIVWSESSLAEQSDDITVIDGVLAKKYAAIISEVSDIEQSLETDSPVVNNSDVNLTIANHEKCLQYLQDQSISLVGLQMRLSINQFDNSGILTGTATLFNGVITNVTFTETDFVLQCENNKYNRNLNILRPGEQLVAGSSSDTDTSYLVTKRVDTQDNPAHELLKFSSVSSFLIVMSWVSATTNDYQSGHQIYSTVDLQSDSAMYNKIVGSWMQIKSSSYDIKGEYRKVLSITPITINDVGNPYKNSLPANYYYEVKCSGAYSKIMTTFEPLLSSQIVDMCTYVEFHKLNFEYYLSKTPITGTINNLFIKKEDSIITLPRMSSSGQFWGARYELLPNNNISVTPDFIEDQDTIKTYTVVPLTSLRLIPDANLGKWQLSKVKVGTLFGEMFLRNNVAPGTVDGIFKKPSTTIETASSVIYNAYRISDRILHYTDDSYQAIVSCNALISPVNDSVIVGIEADLPTMPSDFTFDNAYLGMCAKVYNNHHSLSVDDEPAVKIITREKSGALNKIAEIELNNNGVINNIMPHYYETYNNGNIYQLNRDWEQWTNDDTADGISRFTTLDKLSLDVSNIEEYNKLEKVGLFFARSGGDDGVITSQINIHEMCFIFEHKIDMNEIYV